MSGVRMNDKAGIWQRVSTAGQDEANQLPDLLAWCESHDYDVAKRYVMHGKSASKGKQDPWLDQAIADMSAGLISVLVVWQSSRIERRGAYNAFDLVRRVREAGGRIEYVKDSYLNDATEMSDVMLALAATKDRQKSRDISLQVKASHAAARANGGMTGKPPWGFTTSGPKLARQLLPTPEARHYIPAMFRRARDGDSLVTIARWLDSRGVRPAKGKAWSPASVGQLIRNPAYAGRCVAADGTTVYELPEGDRLVSWELFTSAGQALDARLRRPATGNRPSADPALMTGRTLRCSRCSGPMYRIYTGKVPNRAAYYYCKASPDSGAKRTSRCGNMIRCDVLDRAVWSLLLASRKRVTESHWQDGDDSAVALAEVDAAIRDAQAWYNASKIDLTAFMAEITKLDVKRRDLASREPQPGRYVQVDTGRVFGDVVRELWRDGDPDRAGLRRLLAGRAAFSADSATFPVLTFSGAAELYGLAAGQSIEFAAGALAA